MYVCISSTVSTAKNATQTYEKIDIETVWQVQTKSDRQKDRDRRRDIYSASH